MRKMQTMIKKGLFLFECVDEEQLMHLSLIQDQSLSIFTQLLQAGSNNSQSHAECQSWHEISSDAVWWEEEEEEGGAVDRLKSS